MYKFRMFSPEKIFVGLFIAGLVVAAPTMAIYVQNKNAFIFVDYEALMDQNIVFLDEYRQYYEGVLKKFNGKVPKGYYDDLFHTYVEKLNQYNHWRDKAVEQNKNMPYFIVEKNQESAIVVLSLLGAGLFGLLLCDKN